MKITKFKLTILLTKLMKKLNSKKESSICLCAMKISLSILPINAIFIAFKT